MTSKEIEELAGHRQVPAWVVKLVSDAVAAEREACAESCNRWIINRYEINLLPQAIRGRGQE